MRAGSASTGRILAEPLLRVGLPASTHVSSTTVSVRVVVPPGTVVVVVLEVGTAEVLVVEAGASCC